MIVESTPLTQTRRQVVLEVVGVWLLLAVVSTVWEWPAVQGRVFRDPDDGARLVQVRELLAGQSWWDLFLERIGPAGVEMHWSRHVDALMAAVIVPMRTLVGSEAAETAAIILVPLLLLLAALWLISSTARSLSSRPDVGLYAMVAFGVGATALNRLGPGGLDHHGLQVVLVLLMVRLMIGEPSWVAGLAAGVAGGVSVTVGLETLPVVAAVLAAVGLKWAIGASDARVFYRSFGVSLVAAAVISSYLFGPSSRLLGRECDVLSLGFVGLLLFPALGLAAVGGRSWAPKRRWGALAVMGLAGFAWFAAISPSCAAGPYADLPEEAFRIWIDLIVETQTLAGVLASRPFNALTIAFGPLVGLGFLAWKMWSDRAWAWLPMVAALVLTIAFGVWQVRMLQMALALVAPILGVLVVSIRDRVPWVPLRAVAALSTVLVLSGFLFAFIGQNLDQRSESFAEAAEACTSAAMMDELAALPVGLVAVEMNYGPTVLVHTNHGILASPYHRAYQGVLDTYDLFVSEPDQAAERAQLLGVTYIMVCDDTALSRIWSADNPDGLLAALLSDLPPAWLEKVIDSGRSRVYAVPG